MKDLLKKADGFAWEHLPELCVVALITGLLVGGVAGYKIIKHYDKNKQTDN